MADNESQQPREPISVYSHITMILEQMAAISWQKLGLQPDIMSGAIHTDLAEAKVAIDLTTHLADLLESQLDDEDHRRVQGLIRDLRINYVQKNREVES